MGQYLTAQAKGSINATLPKDKEYFVAFNYGEVTETQEETDRLRIEWRIPDFLSLRRETSDAFISPVFTFLESQCYLMLSPFVDDDVEGWSDIYIHSKTLETSVTYTLGIKKVDGTVENISSFTGTAQGGWFPPLEEKFLKMDDMLERQSALLSSDVLTVIFIIRRAEASDLEEWLYLSDDIPSRWIHLPCESLPEIESVSDSKTAQDKKPEVICPFSNDDIEINAKPRGSIFVCKGTQTDNSEVHKNSQDRSLETKSISKLRRHLEDLLLKSKTHDVNIGVQNRSFKAHKFILRARSPVLSSMFQHDMSEKSSGIISVEDCDPGAFGEFLKYLYTGKAKIDSAKSDVALYYAGDKYDVQDLKEMCVKYLKESTFGTASVCEVIKMATMHDETDLLETASSFFSENLHEILQTDEWQSFILSNVIMANDMLKRAVKNLSKKTQKREIAVTVECPSCSIKQN